MFMRRANVLVGRRGGIRRRAMPLLFLQGYCWFFIFLWVQQGVTLLRFQLKTTCRASRLWTVRVHMLGMLEGGWAVFYRNLLEWYPMGYSASVGLFVPWRGVEGVGEAR